MDVDILEAEVAERDADSSVVRLKVSINGGAAKDMGLALREGRDDPDAWKANIHGHRVPAPPSVALALHEQHPGLVEAEMERICG